MGVIKRIKAWRDMRHEIVQLNYQINGYWAEFNAHVETNDLKDGTDEFEALWAEYRSCREIPEARLAQLQNYRSLRRVDYWDVPLPPRPSEDRVDNEYWEWNRIDQRYYLSSAGHRFIRHEVALERDIKFRPILSWAAIIISVCSLLVTFLKA